MKLGSLFSGGGLGDFGFMAAGMEIAWQCEIDDYCQKILALRYPESKKYWDIKTLKGADLEPVDILTGGFPCQPFSVAGKRKGKDDNRYLWPEMLRVIKECRPRWIVGENVVGITNLALDTVCADLEREGYEVWTIIFPSHALGAWHKRDRIWIICNSEHARFDVTKITGGITTRSSSLKERQEQTSESSRSSEQYAPMADSGLLGSPIHEKQTVGVKQLCPDVANTDTMRLQGSRTDSYSQGRERQNERSAGLCGADRWRTYWEAEPTVGRVANGITDRVHRLKMLGNGQVPACTYFIGKMIMDLTANVVERS